MKHVLTVNSFLFFFFCLFFSNVFAVEFSYIDKDDDFNKIAINDNNGIKYIYAINSETSQAMLFKQGKRDFTYIGDDIDYTMDDIYSITKVKSESDKRLSVMTIFNGSGGQIKKYFIEILNGSLHGAGVITFNFNYNQNPNMQQRCIQNDDNDSEICLVENIYQKKNLYDDISFFGKGLIKSKQKLYRNPEKKALTKSYLIKDDRVIVFDEKALSDKGKWCHIGYKGIKNVFAWIPCASIQFVN